MASRGPTTAVDEILRQLARVRRRRVAYFLQRALYLVLAAATGAAALVLGFALIGGPWVFAAAGAVGLAALAGALVYVCRDVLRAFDDPRRVAFWIDRSATLTGRLGTLVELAARRPAPRFLPLLIEQNVQRLHSWGPSRTIPRPVPLAALAAALAGIGALCVVLLTAPRLAPTLPEIIGTDDAPAGSLTVAGAGDATGRFVLSPVDSRDEAPSGPGAIPAPMAPRSAGTPSTPSLQERIRQRLWGSAWERLRQAAAASRAGERSPGGGRNADQATGGAALPEERLARGQAGDRDRPGQAAADAPAERGGADPLRPGDPVAGHGSDESGGAAPGAGTGASPDDLFGAPIAKHTASDAFELALDAPGRGQEPAPRPPTGDTPPAAPDERPQLAARQRPETAVAHMPVPASYEPIVRALFAHVETTP